ncbi:hypothetical protein MRX96_056708 [Rhipicephalus microplus]
MSTEAEPQADTAFIEKGSGVDSDGNGESFHGSHRRASSASNNNNDAPMINIDPGVESGLLLRVPDLPFSRGSASAESLSASTNQFLKLPASGEHRRHSMQDCSNHHGHHHRHRHRDRKRSCPDVRGASSADRRRRGSRSPLAPHGLVVGGGVDERDTFVIAPLECQQLEPTLVS